MNNKLTSVMGNKFAHKFQTMGHKLTPMHQTMSNIILSRPLGSSIGGVKKIFSNANTGMIKDKFKSKNKNRLTK